ncbi:hypothetical protein BH10ACI1_BH10ACI1_11960 [soil metagenome]
MSENTNSAERLYKILSKAKETAIAPMNAIVGWAMIFEIELIGQDSELVVNPKEQHPIVFHYNVQMSVLHRLFEVNQLVSDIEAKIKRVREIKYDLYLNPYVRIRRTISPTRLNENFAGMLSEISDSDMTIIQFCSEQLSKSFPEKLADELLLKELNNEIQNLYEKISEADLIYELKELLLDLLETMRQAIHEYRIRGVDRLKDGVTDTLGKLILNKEMLQNSGAEEVREVGDIWSKFVSVYSFAADSIQMIEGIEKVLPLLPSIIDTLSK